MGGGELLQIGAWAEAPSYANGLDVCVLRCLHIDARVAHIECVAGGAVRQLQNVGYHLWIGFEWHAVALPKDRHKRYFWKKMAHQPFGGGLVFVRCHGQHHATLLQLRQQTRNAVVRGGVVAVVRIVKGEKMRANALDIQFVALAFGQCALEQFVDAVAHKSVVRRQVVRGKTALLQRIIRRHAKVGNGVEQRAVEVENH